MDKNEPITRALQQGVDELVFPGAVLLVRRQGTIYYHHAVGFTSSLPSKVPTSLSTVYDLASLTKPLATATSLLCLVQEGRLALDQEIQSVLPELEGRPIGQATIRDLLCHRSGLPGWRPLYEKVILHDGKLPNEVGVEGCRNIILEQIAQEQLEYQPRSKSIYSDLGFMLLGFAIEAVSRKSLNQYCAERIFTPLNVGALSYDNGVSSSSDIAPTEQGSWRGKMLQGEVHDENAFALGGTAGHAGLFGTAEAVSVMTKTWLDSYLGRSTFLAQDLVRQFVSRPEKPSDSSWALGWDTPSSPSSSGSHFSSSAFGHLGFSGTSIWIDPEVELEVILLTNRVHPTRENNKIRQFRPMIHDVIYTEVVGR